MSKLVFKPEDFDFTIVKPTEVIDTELFVQMGKEFSPFFCKIAQRLFDQWLSKQPSVFGRLDPQDGVLKFINDPQVVNKTHTARLVCIRPLSECNEDKKEIKK